MLLGLMLLTLNQGTPDYLALASKSFREIESYSITLRSESRKGSEIIRYYYKRPGYVRMEFVKPHPGATLVYHPGDRKVRVRPFESLRFLTLTFDPDDRTVRSPLGHRVDQSDMGHLLKTAEDLRSHGRVEYKGNERAGGRDAIVVSVAGENDYTAELGVNRFILWLDQTTYLPLKAEAYGLDGELIERVVMEDLKVGVDFSVDL